MTQFDNLQSTTDQKITELNDFYKSILNSIKNGVWVTNKDDVIVYTNKGMEKIVGISTEHIIGAQVLKDFPESTLKFFKPIYLKAKEKLNPFSYDSIIVITPGGRESYQSGWLIPRVKDGFFDGMICTVDDITNSKRLEQKFTDSEERYRLLFENMTSGFAYHKIIVDDENNPVDYQFLEANPPFQEFTGLNIDEIIGKTAKQVLPGIEDDPADWIGVFGKVALTRVPVSFENYSESLDRWYNVSVYSPKKNFFAVTFTDVSSRKKAEQEVTDLAKFPSENPNPVLRVNEEEVIYINSSGRTLLSTKKNNKIPVSLKEAIHKVFATNKIKEIEVPFNGSIYSFVITPIRELGYVNLYGRDVTKRKKSEDKYIKLSLELEQKVRERTNQLQESEEKYRTIADHSMVGISIIQDNEFKYANQKFLKDLDYPHENLEDRKLEELLEIISNPEDIQKIRAITRKNQRGKGVQPTHLEIKITTISGEEKCFESYSRSIMFEGRPAAMNINLDITQRKQSVQKLKESESRYRELFNNMSSGVAVYQAIENGEDFIFKDLNKSGEIISKVKPEEIIGKSVIKLFPGIKSTGLFDVFQKVWKSGIPEYNATSLYSDDRITHWMENYVYKLPTGELISVYDDVSEKRIAELELKKSEEKYRTLTSNIPGMVYRGNTDWMPNFITNCEGISGYSADEFLSQKINWSDIIHRDDKERVINECLKLVENPLEISLDYRIITKDGAVRWVKDRKTSLFTEEGLYKGADGIVFDITDRKKVEQKLIESEKRFSTAWYMNPSLMAISDLESGEFIEVNNTFLETIRAPREEIIGKSARMLYDDPRDRDFLIKELKEKGKVVNYELNFKNALGEPLTGLFSFDVVEMEGKPYLISVATDITERKQAEQELKESEERFRSTFEQAAVGIAHVAPDGTFLRINQRYCDIVKYSHNEMLSRSFQDITYSDDLEEDLNFIELMLMGKLLNYSMEKRYICKDDSIVWVNLTVTLVRKESSDPKYFISVIEDISEKKAAEEKLQESEENYRLFIENFHGIAFKGYRDFSVGFFQGAIEKITGYEEQDFISERIKWDQLIHPEDMPIIRKKIEEFHKSPQNSEQREYRIIDKHGKIHWLLESIQKIQGITNNKDGVQGTIIDVTDKKEAEELIIEENTKLQELNQMKIDLINRISTN